MTADSQWPVRQAIYSALTAAAGVTTLVPAVRIFDHVPPRNVAETVETAFPYIVVGEMTVSEFDTKTSNGAEITAMVHTWSRYRGFKECEQIMAAVVAAIDQQALSVSGHDLVLCRFEFGDTSLDPDGLTRHGVQRFRIVTDADV